MQCDVMDMTRTAAVHSACCTAAETRTLQRAEAKIHEEPGPTFRKLTAARLSASRRFRALEAKPITWADAAILGLLTERQGSNIIMEKVALPDALTG